MKLLTVSAVSAAVLLGSIASVSAQRPAAPASAPAVQAPARPGDVEVDKPETNLVNTPEFQITGGQNKRFETRRWLEIEFPYSTRGPLTDEITFAVNVLVGGKLLPGTVTYTQIPEGKHFGVMYVAPRALESIAGRNVNANAIQGVWITATNSQGVTVGLFPKRQTPIPNVPRQDGLLLKKPETPFAPLYWDRYEALKSQR
jgi:hypothetical protein